MDARDFIKVSVAGLGLRIPVASKANRARIHSLASPCFCEIRLPGFPVQTAPVPLVCAPGLEPDPRLLAASFYLDHRALQKLVSPVSCMLLGSSAPCLEIVLHTGPLGIACGVGEGKMIGVLSMPISSDWAAGATTVQQQVVHAGWVRVGSGGKEKKAGGGGGGGAAAAELHAIVRVESDPRYVFRFDGDIAMSPQIVQLKGLGKGQQPVFSCKFSKDRLFRTRPGGQGDQTPSRAGGAAGGLSDKESRERKGWLVTIHDLSGSPVAAASMVTPFVPFTGSDRVSRSNPGAWLILVPDPAEHNCCWRPWGRLEGWREAGRRGLMGLKFHLVSDSAGGGMFSGIHVCETMISRRGGEFAIDTGRSLLGSSQQQQPSAAAVSPAPTPQSSGDCSFYLGLAAPTTAEGGGFVMSCELQRGGRRGSGAAKKATVQLSTRHIGCVEDAAVFLALAAAVDLSRDACQPFSRKLRKELCQD